MSRKILVYAICLFAGVTPMVIYYKYHTSKVKGIIEQLNREYQLLDPEGQIAGKVSKIFHPYPEIFNDDPSQAYLLVKDTFKIRVYTGSELKTSVSLDSVLNMGDYLLKKKKSDTLVIIHVQGGDTIQYKFQLLDDQKYPFRKPRK